MSGYANRPALRIQPTTALPYGARAARNGAALWSARYWYDKKSVSIDLLFLRSGFHRARRNPGRLDRGSHFDCTEKYCRSSGSISYSCVAAVALRSADCAVRAVNRSVIRGRWRTELRGAVHVDLLDAMVAFVRLLKPARDVPQPTHEAQSGPNRTASPDSRCREGEVLRNEVVAPFQLGMTRLCRLMLRIHFATISTCR